MCGLVGVAGNTNAKWAKVFRDLLVFDTVRGFDSTGVALVGYANSKPIIEKELGGATNLWEWQLSKELDYRGVSKLCRKVYLGHNRAATIGKITVDNAHPFQYGDITGAHNGSLRTWDNLHDSHKLDVDSKAVFSHLSEHGIEDLWSKLNGAAALTWWDSEKETMNFIRNSERPLYMATNESKDVLIWASEEWMIHAAVGRNKLKLGNMSGNGNKVLDKVFLLKTNFHSEFKIKANGYEVVGGNNLEAFVPPKKNWAPMASNLTGGQNTFKAKASKRQKFNDGWGAGLEKAPKEIRGLQAEFVDTHSYTQFSTKVGGNIQVRKALLKLDKSDTLPEGAKLYVYSYNESIWEKWCKRKASGQGFWFKLKARPRVQVGDTGKVIAYHVDDAGVFLSGSYTKKVEKLEKPIEEVDYDKLLESIGEEEKFGDDLITYFNGDRVTPTRLLSILKDCSPKDSCADCLSPLDTNELNDIHWVGPREPICKDCMLDKLAVAYSK